VHHDRGGPIRTRHGPTGKRPSIQTTELRKIGRRLGKLAVARYRQAGELRVRQEEQLRRALRTAGEALGWGLLTLDPSGETGDVAADIRRLTRAGLRQLERDLEAEISDKRKEVRQLRRTVNVLEKLAENDPAAFPTEIEYRYTAKQGQDGLVTKTEEVVLEDSEEAQKTAEKLERRLDRLSLLRDQMVEHLQQRRETLSAAKAELRNFVRGTGWLVDEVLATLT
jgi:hypothetical protein